MPQSVRTQVNINNLPRDPEDRAYHCPICQAPFTRRSNLRRHFIIHTRSMPFKCSFCNTGFTRSDDFHYHILHCNDMQKKSSGDSRFQQTQNFDQSTAASPVSTTVDPTTTPPNTSLPFGQNTSVPSSPFNPFSQIADQEVDQAFSDFITSLDSEYPTPGPSPFAGSPYSDSGYPDRPPSSASMSSLMTSSTGSQPTLERWTHINHQRNTKPYCRNRQKNIERPVYTRRQVDEMLSAVSACFVEKLEEVLRHTNGGAILEFPHSGTKTTTCEPVTLAKEVTIGS